MIQSILDTFFLSQKKNVNKTNKISQRLGVEQESLGMSHASSSPCYLNICCLIVLFEVLICISFYV